MAQIGCQTFCDKINLQYLEVVWKLYNKWKSMASSQYNTLGPEQNVLHFAHDFYMHHPKQKTLTLTLKI